MNNAFYGEERDNIAYLWQNSFDEETRVLTMDLTFFVKTEGDLYRRFEEQHLQRVHEPEELIALLSECGFSDIRAWGDRELRPYNESDLRIHFTAKKA